MHPTRPIDDPRSDPLTLRLVAWVALGGAIGTSLRYGLGRLLPVGAGEVPWATLTANVVGAFVLGGLVVALDRWDRGPRRGDPRLRHLLALGLVGSFTTYSAFSVEVVDLLDYDVTLAQGNLFSPPRPVRADVMQDSPPASSMAKVG